MESAAASILKRAVEMDQKEQFTLAFVLYQEGVQILLDFLKELVIKQYRIKAFDKTEIFHYQSKGIFRQSRKTEGFN